MHFTTNKTSLSYAVIIFFEVLECVCKIDNCVTLVVVYHPPTDDETGITFGIFQIGIGSNSMRRNDTC